MSETIPDVVLISADPQFCEVVERHRPRTARLRCADLEELAAEGPVAARQVWVDLDTASNPPVPEGGRRVYFYSRQESIPEGLPAGLFLHKPCAAVVFEVLWADLELKAAGELATVATRAGRTLSAWLLDFQELKLGALCRMLITGLAPRLGYRNVSLYLHDFRRGVLTLTETTHSRPIEQTVPLGAAGQHLMVAVARSGRFFRTDHAPDELAARGIPRPEDRSYNDDTCLIAPLCSEGEVWGVLNFSGRTRTALTEDDPPLDEIFTFLGRALHQARAYDQARTEARVDSLTGLYNQRWMTESLEKEIRRAERFGTPLAALMIDLDGLKSINDQQGHAGGDCVLRHVAGRITRVLRHFDGAARMGGDEFVVMLPATNLKGARQVARRVLASIRKEAARFRDVELPMTASIGATEWRVGWNAAQLIEAADQAMYDAKQNGRDKLATQVNSRSSPSPKP
ncbi:MAG: sensor domain-containing diguanylate cyclase [Phycisphaerae bacterium]|nr:sensor domain-containing diguanylate cyclase [Phycisphaerae bacterium]